MTKKDRLDILKKIFNIQNFEYDRLSKRYSFKLNNSKISFGFGLMRTNKNFIFMTHPTTIKIINNLEKSNEIINCINPDDIIIIKFVGDFKNIKI